ncbi:MAG: phosphate signaling complex protein PhoU, partial [Rhodospirillaceae bacterium]
SVRVLALRQPLADDLRSVVTALKVAGMLDRVGDYGAEAAERAQQLVAGPEIPVHGTIRRMGSLVRDMYVDAADAFLSRDPLLAKSVWARDEEVDAVHSGLFRELLTYMLEDPRLISSCSHLLFISKTVERYGDQATNIAEAAYYRTTGYPMEGERPKGDVSTLMAVGSDPDDILPL